MLGPEERVSLLWKLHTAKNRVVKDKEEITDLNFANGKKSSRILELQKSQKHSVKPSRSNRITRQRRRGTADGRDADKMDKDQTKHSSRDTYIPDLDHL